MRVAYLTAGAGGMICGSCLRDNALAAALIRQGRDVVLIPVYSPLRTEENDVSTPRVFYGGINLYLQQRFALARRAPRFVDRLLDWPALLRFAMRWAGSASPDSLGELTVSILRGEQGRQHRELEKLLAALEHLRPDLVHLPNAFFVGLAGPIKKRLAVPVVCTLTGEDIFIDKLSPAHRARVLATIQEKSRDVDGFLGVSAYYLAYAVDHLGIDRSKSRLVPLGVRIEPDAGLDDRPKPRSAFRIGYLARICHDKGLHVLCAAYDRLRQQGRDCRLVVAGYLGKPDRRYFTALRRDLVRRGHADRVDYLAEVDRPGKIAFLRSLDVFSVPTVYREAKGLYLLEALAEGVPVVQPRHGSFPELVEATGGGLLVEPGDPAALAQAIARLMDDADLRRRLGQMGRVAVRQSFTDELMAERAWRVFEEYVGAGHG